ncbi:MAG: TonB-dependent receptor [Bacteroidaceae bacterium]|nr:TonB-dependent receptor [Bacteroidaceae bacterium]
MNRFLNIVLLFSFLSCTSLFAQQSGMLLKGNVVDASGQTVIGASVIENGGSNGTITDFNGNFSLRVLKKVGVVKISFIGYVSQNIAYKPGVNFLKVVLKDDTQQMDEIVVVGYGLQKKSSLTSSVEMVRSEDLMQMPTANLDEALSGQAAGLQVVKTSGDPSSGQEASIHIRGINGSPLLVIDGVPRFSGGLSNSEMRLSDLNPDDIESISILKDGAAAAVYGVRAASGVILVKTKRASKNQKISIKYRGQFNLQEATYLPKFLDSYDFAKLFNTAVANSPDTQYAPYTDEQLEMIRTQSNPNKYANENMLDYLNKFGYSTIHSLSISGGNKMVRYYFSGGYTTTQGLYGGVGRDRYNYSAKVDATLAKGLTLSFDLTGSRSDNKTTSYTTISSAYSYSPLQPFRYTDGRLASNDGGNALISVDGLGGYIENKTNMTTLSTTLRYEFQKVKGLSAYLRGTIDTNFYRSKSFDKPTTLYLYDENTGITSEDPKTTYPLAKISLDETNNFVDNKLFEVGVNYDRTFAQKHHVTGLVVVNYQALRTHTLSGNNNDLSGIYPESGTTSVGYVSNKDYFLQRQSLIGRATYSYDNRYFVESSFRVDGSTKFTPEKRWAIFPTVSASWILSNENFYKNWDQSILSNVKFRASMGLLGDDGGVDEFSYLMSYIYAPREGYNIDGNFKQGVVPATGTYPNPDLEWGKSRDYNIAADLGFWENRFGLSFEYYWRYRTNMIKTAPGYLIPPSAGLNGSLPSLNFGEIKAWGWDLTFTHKNSIHNLKYNVALTLAQTRDKYLDYGDESTVASNLRREGTSSMSWLLYEADGLFQSQEEIDNYTLDQDGSGNASIAPGDIKYKDQNGDGTLDENDRIYVKNSSTPSFTMSLRLGVKYKGFFANVMFQGASGYQQTMSELYTLNNSSLQRFQDYHLTDTWSETNRDATYPRVKFATTNDNNRRSSTFWVKDCDFIRLKSLSLGYSLASNVVKKLKLTSASLSLNASNLYTWSSLDGLDPESLRGYPIQRSYGMTLNLGF